MLQLALLHCQEEHRPRSQVEENGAVLLETPVELQRLREQLVDPGRRLAKEKAAVAA